MSSITDIVNRYDECKFQIKESIPKQYRDIEESMNQITDIVYSLAKELENYTIQQKITHEKMIKIFDNLNSVVILQKAKNGGAIYKNKAILKIFKEGVMKEKKRFQLLLIELLNMGSGSSKKKQYYDEVNDSWYSVDTEKLDWDDEEVVYLHTLTNINNMKQIEEQLINEANIDRMTGVYNRSGGKYIYRKFINTLSKGEDACLCMIDLDGLKKINDRHGHCAGDEVIIKLADVIKKSISAEDIVSRIGGDEFVIVLKKPVDDGKKIIESMQNKIRNYNAISTKPYRIEFSYGICEVTSEDVVFDEVSNRADNLMYRYKSKKSKRI